MVAVLRRFSLVEGISTLVLLLDRHAVEVRLGVSHGRDLRGLGAWRALCRALVDVFAGSRDAKIPLLLALLGMIAAIFRLVRS